MCVCVALSSYFAFGTMQREKNCTTPLAGSRPQRTGEIHMTALQTWQRPTLPRLKTKYHRRRGVSRPSSEWDRVQPPRHNRQVSGDVMLDALCDSPRGEPAAKRGGLREAVRPQRAGVFRTFGLSNSYAHRACATGFAASAEHVIPEPRRASQRGENSNNDIR